jgi:hypothetical protein
MNSLIRNKKKAKIASQKMGHKMGKFYMFLGFALSRCVVCGRMLYVAGKPHNHLYGKLISGDTIKELCIEKLA